MSKSEEKNEIDEAKNFAYYINRYRGAIIGFVVALLFIATGLSKVLIGLLLIVAGAFLGNYIQKNKSSVKETLKQFIDKF